MCGGGDGDASLDSHRRQSAIEFIRRHNMVSTINQLIIKAETAAISAEAQSKQHSTSQAQAQPQHQRNY